MTLIRKQFYKIKLNHFIKFYIICFFFYYFKKFVLIRYLITSVYGISLLLENRISITKQKRKKKTNKQNVEFDDDEL